MIVYLSNEKNLPFFDKDDIEKFNNQSFAFVFGRFRNKIFFSDMVEDKWITEKKLYDKCKEEIGDRIEEYNYFRITTNKYINWSNSYIDWVISVLTHECLHLVLYKLGGNGLCEPLDNID